MYAVIVSGGKQYRVQEGHTLKLEKLAASNNKNGVESQVASKARQEIN